jgi:CheY-like chemotaxis protein
MPRMSGDELAKKLLEIKPGIPVVLCTGFNEDITEETALEMGILKLIMKPVIKNDLAATIRSVLDQPLPN